MTSSTVLIVGNTYPVKDSIKALGGRWDAIAKGWRVPADKAPEAQSLVAGAPVKPAAERTYSPRSAPRNWSACGFPGCRPGWCENCDGEGYRYGR